MVSPEIFSSEPSKEQLTPHGLLVLLTGPTGVGKDTVLNNLKIPYQRIITHTSRKQGLHEQEGLDYHFVTKEKFEAMIEADEFLEHYENLRGDYYGTTKEELAKKRSVGLTIWRLNPDGVFNLLDDPKKRTALEPFTLICLVANLNILAERIKERRREKGWDVIERAKQASVELDLIDRKIQAAYEEDEVVRRLGEVGYENLMFHNGHSWVDDMALATHSRIAVRLVENREGLQNPDGFPRTMKLVEETIKDLTKIWHL